jgi:signal transduction histidine kinase
VNAFETLDSLDRATAQLEAAFQSPADEPPDAHRVAGVLHDCFPEALATACLLPMPEGAQVALLDRAGRPWPGEEEKLAALALTPQQDRASRWSAHLAGPDRAVELAAVGAEGLLALVLPGDYPDVAVARLWLRNAARALSLALGASTDRRACLTLQEEAWGLERLANVGELAGPLAHEFSNFLNVLLLQVMVLEYQLPEPQKADLVEVRRQGHLANELIGRFHQHRRAQPHSVEEVDLPCVLASTAEELRRESPLPGTAVVVVGAGAATATLAGKPPADTVWLVLDEKGPCPLHAPPIDLKRLIRFLLWNAVRAAAHGGRVVRATTGSETGISYLWVDDNGPALSSEALGRLFEAAAPGREGVEPLELAACQSIARRLGWRIQADGLPEGGVRLWVEFAPLPGA